MAFRLLLTILLTASLGVLADPKAAPAGRQPVDPDEVVDRVADYVADYTRDFIGVVAEESYRQEMKSRSTARDLRGFPVEGQSQSRTLKSDVLLVRAPAGDRWLQFRDVFDVDGKPVRDREERLAKLFLTPSASAQQQIDDIKRASARYNLGPERTINMPVLALTIFEPANRPWFAFTLGKQKGQTIELEFREQRGFTMIRGRDERGTPATGKVQVDRATGRVLTTELHADTDSMKAQIDVVFEAEASLAGLFVPKDMREKYEARDGTVITGRAAYAKFRRYTVTTGETLKK